MKKIILPCMFILSNYAFAADKNIEQQIIESLNIPKLSASEQWACNVHLCLANPNGAMAEPECKPPVKKYIRWLKRHSGLPFCPGSNAKVDHNIFNICDEKTEAFAIRNITYENTAGEKKITEYSPDLTTKGKLKKIIKNNFMIADNPTYCVEKARIVPYSGLYFNNISNIFVSPSVIYPSNQYIVNTILIKMDDGSDYSNVFNYGIVKDGEKWSKNRENRENRE